MVAPGRRGDEETLRGEVVAVPIEAGVTQQVVQAVAPSSQLRRQGDVALALRRSVVDHRQQPLIAILPGAGEEIVPGWIVAPGGPALTQLPAAVAHLGPLEH